MMKLRKWFVSVTLCVCLMMTIHAAFGDVTSTIQYNAESGVLNVRCQGLYADTTYSIAFLKAGAENWIQENLVYLNQVMASSGGELNISFIHVQFPICTVWLGGPTDEGASPLILGTVCAQMPVTLPVALTRIEKEAFYGIPFSIVYIGDQVTYIGDRAFQDCSNLLEVHIPDSVTEFGVDVFARCRQVVIVCSQGSAAWQYAVTNGLAHRAE